MARKLSSVHQDLTILAGQGMVDGFLKSVGNASKLAGLLEDIRDAMMEYQVRMLLSSLLLRCLTFELDLIATRYLRQVLSAHRESSTTRPPLVLSGWWIERKGSRSSQQDAPRFWCRIPLWEQAGVPEGNKEGCPGSNRILAGG